MMRISQAAAAITIVSIYSNLGPARCEGHSRTETLNQLARQTLNNIPKKTEPTINPKSRIEKLLREAEKIWFEKAQNDPQNPLQKQVVKTKLNNQSPAGELNPQDQALLKQHLREAQEQWDKMENKPHPSFDTPASSSSVEETGQPSPTQETLVKKESNDTQSSKIDDLRVEATNRLAEGTVTGLLNATDALVTRGDIKEAATHLVQVPVTVATGLGSAIVYDSVKAGLENYVSPEYIPGMEQLMVSAHIVHTIATAETIGDGVADLAKTAARTATVAKCTSLLTPVVFATMSTAPGGSMVAPWAATPTAAFTCNKAVNHYIRF